MAFNPPQVGQTRPDHAQVVHAAMLIKAGVLNGQHRIFHHLGNLPNGRQIAPLFAIFTNQCAFC